eukprot:7728962-Pyramimonas_sp.AAC.1
MLGMRSEMGLASGSLPEWLGPVASGTHGRKIRDCPLTSSWIAPSQTPQDAQNPMARGPHCQKPTLTCGSALRAVGGRVAPRMPS